jgi:hypothetical protein
MLAGHGLLERVSVKAPFPEFSVRDGRPADAAKQLSGHLDNGPGTDLDRFRARDGDRNRVDVDADRLPASQPGGE